MSIRVLDPIVASRIAAGEVVERPGSVLRELLDNAIDSGANVIKVYLEDGGIKSLTVSDNGCGITEEDLPMVCMSHATSKVSTLNDLFSLKTLGFRGEAMCSIASCSTLTIQSSGKKITVDNGNQGKIVPGSVTEGTTVTMLELFEKIPARRQFLKRPSAELSECRKVFTEKALGFENVEFLLFSEGNLITHLQKSDKKGRTLQIMSQEKNFDTDLAVTMNAEEEDVKLFAVASDPSNYRRDRGQIKVFVNNRIIDCFPIVQTVANAYSSALPGGAFPFLYLFIEDNPALVDFNIHPAKRECKIRNQSIVCSLASAMIRKSLLSERRKEAAQIRHEPEPQELFSSRERIGSTPEHKNRTSDFHYSTEEVRKPAAVREHFDPSWFERAKKVLNKTSDKEQIRKSTANIPAKEKNYRYIGQIFNTFLIVQTQDEVLFIDQHAAHERILYNELTSLKDVQNLVIPHRFETDTDVDGFLLENSFIYQDIGVQLVRVEPMVWELTGIPAACRKNEQEIVNYIQNATGDAEEAEKGLFAVISCHSAIKAGDTIDSVTASNLIDKVFELDAMVCPHGRSFVFRISEKTLMKEVGRVL